MTRNAIAAVGLGRVAAGRDDAAEARMWFLRALEIDPDEAAAKRLLAALDRELAAPHAAEAPPGPEQARQTVRRAAPEKRRSLLDRVRAWLGRRPGGRRG